MSAPISFNLAAKAARNAAEDKAELDPIPFSITDAAGKAHGFVAKFPPEGELLVFMSAQSIDAEDAEVAGALMNLLSSMFEREQYRLLRRWLRSGEMSTELLSGMIEQLLEKWSGGFPTQRSGVSAGPQQPTGARSTGRSPGKGSTRAVSASTAS